MINEIHINHFRGFQNLQLVELKRVNVIVGPNAAGKTALMEAIFLAGGANPDLTFRIKAFRGLAALTLSNARGAYEALWRDLFHKFDTTKEVLIRLTGTSEHSRTLAISYRQDGSMVLPLESRDPTADVLTTSIPITFEWTLPSGRKHTARPTFQMGGLAIQSLDGIPPLPLSFFSSSLMLTQEENAAQFSALSVKNGEEDIVAALRLEFPFIRGLSVQLSGGAPTIFASIEGIDEKIPIQLLSSGITKLLGILLGIATQRGGIVCIDEIENGFYYDRLPSIWKLVLQFAVKFNVQIFASTHSWECLQAATLVVDEAPKEFALLQGTFDNGRLTFVQHSAASFAAAIHQNMDVR